MPTTRIDAAIRELQHEQERIQGVISALKAYSPEAALESAQGAANVKVVEESCPQLAAAVYHRLPRNAGQQSRLPRSDLFSSE